MVTTAKKIGRKFTWDDYKHWPDDERWEIIDGEAYNMTPAPSIRHQAISGELFGILRDHLKGHPCRPFIAPTDVILSESDIVQPDVLVVCDKSKITEANIQGAPDMVVEILSPSTSVKDKREKKTIYERFGVREYIIVNPMDDSVERYFLDLNRYIGPEIFNWDEILVSKIFPDLHLDLKDIFGRTEQGLTGT